MTATNTIGRRALLLLAATSLANCKTVQPQGASVKALNVTQSDASAKLTATVDGQNVVHFAFHGGNGDDPIQLLGEEVGPSEMVTAASDGNGGKSLVWKGVTIGSLDANGELTLCTGPTNEVCDADVIQKGLFDPATMKPIATSVMRLAFTNAFMQKSAASIGGAAPSGAPAAMALDDASANVTDISNFAMPEINQHYAATCLYNSTTAIVEWYRNRANKVMERLSAPDVLARLDAAAGGTVGERYAVANVGKLGGIVPDQYFPTQATYDQYGADANTGFQATQTYASRFDPSVVANKVSIPGPIKTSVLYMIAEPARGVRTTKGVPLADFQKIRDWIATYHTPVHFFAYYGDIWHAIVALGYREDQGGWLLIKDSLAVKTESAHWVSLEAYRQNTYGAIGTYMDSDAPNGVTIGDGAGGGNSNSATNTTASNGSLQVQASTVVSGNQTMLVFYVNQQATNVQFWSPSDNRWFPMTMNYQAQNGWPVVTGVAVGAGWAQVNQVQVSVTVNGQQQTLTANVSH